HCPLPLNATAAPKGGVLVSALARQDNRGSPAAFPVPCALLVAVAREQGRLLATRARAVAQLVELLGSGEAIQARALVHDDRLLLARVAHGRLGTWQLVTVQRSDATIMGRASATTIAAVTALATLSGLAAALATVLARAIAAAVAIGRAACRESA